MSSNTEEPTQSNESLSIGLSIIGGVGFTLMSIALGVGVVQGETASSGVIGALFWGGLVMLIGASVAWFGITRPDQHFDDIDQPLYTGHHDEH